MPHFPKGTRYTALEKNILKQRAFETALILFLVEDLKEFVVGSIRATDQILRRGEESRLPEGTKRLYQRAWQVLVDDGIISPEESEEVQSLIDYRNIVAHHLERTTVDVHRDWRSNAGLPSHDYDPSALNRLTALSDKISERMGGGYILELSLRPAIFEPAELAYREEIHRLRHKIKTQLANFKAEMDQVNLNVAGLPKNLLDELQPSHPRNFTGSGTLSAPGIKCCYALFEAGATPRTVAYLMRLSLRSSRNRFVRWTTESNHARR